MSRAAPKISSRAFNVTYGMIRASKCKTKKADVTYKWFKCIFTHILWLDWNKPNPLITGHLNSQLNIQYCEITDSILNLLHLGFIPIRSKNEYFYVLIKYYSWE